LENQPLQIDIKQVIASKSAKLSRWLPGFVIRWFQGFVHQDDLNHILSKYHGYGGTDFASNVIEEMQCAIHVINKDNIPNKGHVVVVANHPMAGLDALALFSEVGKIKKSVKIIANDVLAHIPQFKENFIPVNKFGKKAKDSMVMVDQAYASGEMMIVFPAGLCSRKIDGVIMDLDWQKSFLAKAIQYNYTIIPVHVNGCNSNRFYRLANWRKFLGIKFNIEMLTLADELYKQKGKEITLTIGKPISSSIFNKKNVWNEAQQLKKFVYTLQGNPNATFQLD
jgi:putative hemolysin